MDRYHSHRERDLHWNNKINYILYNLFWIMLPTSWLFMMYPKGEYVMDKMGFFSLDYRLLRLK